MTYEIKGEWLHTPLGPTKHWDERDILWIKSGGKPVTNSEGYIVMPYGNVMGKETYPWRQK